MPRNSTPLSRSRRTVATMSSVRSAMCCVPAERYQSRNSWIWLFLSPEAGSLIGNLMRPLPFVITFDMRALNSVWMTLSS